MPPESTALNLLIPPLRGWRLVLACALVCATVTGVVCLIVPRTFTASTSFSADVGSGSILPGGLAGLAGRIGLPGGRTGSSQPDFFAQVLTSEEILRATLLSPYDDDRAEPVTSRPLLDILDIKGKTEEQRIAKGIRRMRSKVRTTFSSATDIVTLEVDARTPGLSAAVANRMVQLLDSFNIVRRQFQSRELRRFTGERLALARQELAAAEAGSLRFLETNRQIGDSPVLQFQAKRLEREVSIRQEVVLTLARDYEEARTAERRDVPVITVIDPARPPQRKSAPRIALYSIMAMVMGGLLGLAVTYVRAMWRAEIERNPEVAGAIREAVGSARVGMQGLLRRR